VNIEIRRYEGNTINDKIRNMLPVSLVLSDDFEGSKLRLRPIIMTSLAFVAGLFPMSIATGPSAQGNHSISIGAAGGMVSGVILGLLIIPVLFVVFQSLQEKISGKPVSRTAHEALENYGLSPL
jgi:HAE1 family hydrophobic/amphiphilic exporter-1